MTLAVAAAQIGISGAYLSRLEKGGRQPSIGVLFEVARVYQISLGDLLGEPPAPTTTSPAAARQCGYR
jgi:transcriptional regulator with XRE-family HTH domain